MIVGTLQLKIHFPNPQSLKEKRMLLKSLLTRLRQEFNAGIAELDGMDLWQYSVIGAVCIGREKKELDQILDKILGFLDRENNLQVIEHEKELW